MMTVLFCVAVFATVVVFTAAIDFIGYMSVGRTPFYRFRHVLGILVMAPGVIILYADGSMSNDCCGDSALFSPHHRLSVYALSFFCLAAFFFSVTRRKLAPPMMEVLINCLLIIGIAFDIAVGFQEKEWYFWVFGNLPIATRLIIALAENHQLAVDTLEQQEIVTEDGVNGIFRQIVFLPSWKKFPLLLLLCLPVLTVMVAALLLFGQKPDSLVRAFTDTYKHGLSQLDPECAGVVCGGHFLCTIAPGCPTLFMC